MDIQAEKISLAQMLLQTEDITILKKVKAIFYSKENDWWDELSQSQKESIEEGLVDFEKGRTIPYDEVKKQLGIF